MEMVLKGVVLGDTVFSLSLVFCIQGSQCFQMIWNLNRIFFLNQKTTIVAGRLDFDLYPYFVLIHILSYITNVGDHPFAEAVEPIVHTRIRLSS